MDFNDLVSMLEKSSKDYVINEDPYKSFVEERSGFLSGVEWTLKKLKKKGFLKIDKTEKSDIMKIFLVQKIGEINWGEFDEAVVIATDALNAERLIRTLTSVRKAKLKVIEIPVPDKEQVLMYCTGEENFTKKRETTNQ